MPNVAAMSGVVWSAARLVATPRAVQNLPIASCYRIKQRLPSMAVLAIADPAIDNAGGPLIPVSGMPEGTHWAQALLERPKLCCVDGSLGIRLAPHDRTITCFDDDAVGPIEIRISLDFLRRLRDGVRYRWCVDFR